MFNKVILIGNLGKDVELATSVNGKTYAKLNMATSRFFSGKDGAQPVQETQWHSVRVWGNGAEKVAKYPKGSRVFVEGFLNYFTPRNSETRIPIPSIRAEKVRLLKLPQPKAS